MLYKQVESVLNELPLGDKKKAGSLRHLAFVIGGDVYKAVKYAVKDYIVSILTEYYCTPNRFELLWNGLSEAERKIASFHVWSNGTEPVDVADEIAKEFNIAETARRSIFFYYGRNGLASYKEKYADTNSVLWIIFPKSYNNQIFINELRNAVGKMKRAYSSVSNKFVFSSRESRMSDFANVVRFCNSNKVAFTKNGTLSKPSALKLQSFCGYEEYTLDINASLKDIRTTDGLLVTFPLSVLCVIGGLTAISEGICVPGAKSLSLLNLPREHLIKKLFQSYLNSKSFDEVSIIKGIKAKRGHNPTDARQNLAEELKLCPIGQAVYTKEIERYLRIVNKGFARRDERHVIESGNSYYEYSAEWSYYEHLLINIILTFFGALGIIDIAWGENSDIYADRERRVPIAFKINQLGAFVLGLSDSYSAPIETKTKVEGGFTVLPDYTIIIPDSKSRIKHELYFEKLFSKVSETDEATVYKIDFETVVRGMNNGVSVADLRSYLLSSDRPLPENVSIALDDWERQSGRIRLRKVTVLECDDEMLLEEVIRYKGMGAFVKEKISAAVVVEDDATGKIKKVIEKNKRFCKDVI